MPVQRNRLPQWLHTRIPETSTYKTTMILKDRALNTVCESARCPNRSECYSKKRATFMIMGSVCSRDCRFCSIETGLPQSLDPLEPGQVAEAVRLLDLKHVVITSVTRDDLSDGGAEQFFKTVRAIRSMMPQASIEVLVPDFGGNIQSVDLVARSEIDIFNHNIETVPRLYADIRSTAEYNRSLEILQFVKTNYSEIYTKSGLMVGLGERDDEIFSLLDDLDSVGCDIVTIGQYLKPAHGKAEIARYVAPEDFAKYAEYAYNRGIKYVSAAPLVRSSYNAEEVYSIINSSKVVNCTP